VAAKYDLGIMEQKVFVLDGLVGEEGDGLVGEEGDGWVGEGGGGKCASFCVKSTQ